MTKVGKAGVHMAGRGDGRTGHPTLWDTKPAAAFEPFPNGGGYPVGFLEWAYRTLHVADPERVVHLCSGSVNVGITVDIRPEMNPTYVADARHVPLPDGSVPWVMADPPYSEDYARNLYGTGDEYPRPAELLREAERLLVPGGRVGILHFQVPMHRTRLRLLNVWGITQGPGYNIRAWSVYQKPDAGLGL